MIKTQQLMNTGQLHNHVVGDRAWEQNDFQYTVSIHNDTLIQYGVEKVEATGIDRLNTEKYIRVNVANTQ
jgi:hypothetical protein